MAKFSTKIFLWFISLAVFLNADAQNSIITRPESSFVPDVNFFNEAGEKVFLDQFDGKTILLSFWASWCGSCTEELPSLDVLQKDFRKLSFEVVAVSEDFSGIEAAKAHFNKYGIRHLKLYHDYKNELFRAMSVIGLPTAFLINPDGKIKVIFKGNTKWHDESIRDILISEISGNPDIPKNSYITTSLNKKIAPITIAPEERAPQKPADKTKTNVQDNSKDQQPQNQNLKEQNRAENKKEKQNANNEQE